MSSNQDKERTRRKDPGEDKRKEGSGLKMPESEALKAEKRTAGDALSQKDALTHPDSDGKENTEPDIPFVRLKENPGSDFGDREEKTGKEDPKKDIPQDNRRTGTSEKETTEEADSGEKNGAGSITGRRPRRRVSGGKNADTKEPLKGESKSRETGSDTGKTDTEGCSTGKSDSASKAGDDASDTGIVITDLDHFDEGTLQHTGGHDEISPDRKQAEGQDAIIHMEHIVKKFYIGTENELEVLHGINLDIKKGEFTSIVGESGSGKSTLMNIIGLLDHPTDGSYRLLGWDTAEMTDDELSDVRGSEIGFVFQTYNLIPRMSALKNVEMPMIYARVPLRERTERAEELLELVGMQERMDHNPDELSGGQKQRVAIARAMANDPSIILADEPTGALDSKTGHLIMDLFHELHEKQGRTIVLITHSAALAEETGRIVTISDGRIVGERKGTRC